jgi:ATP-binding cassette subfamily B (MDR/TAP) protein 1
VSFSYPTRPDQPALREATIFFPAGDTTFVVGRSGSGKSTLGQLLIRFYEPGEGKILLDGVALSTLDARWLRENVMLVEQHSVLFNDSIRRNIELARKDETVSGAEVDEAVRFALLESMVKDLPNGLDTLVGMKGDSLSGGQKQRVALARARLRDTPVLVLDESTSALDYITRFAVLQAIRTWRKGKTTIVITHDMTQILPDDYVYILDKARVVQEGYRKTMEKIEHSPFHTFLENTEDDNDKWDSTSDDSNDDILSLYAAAWTPARTAHEMLFNEPVLTPFFSPVRTSMYRASMLYDKRHSYVPSEFGAPSSNAVLDSKGLAKQPPFNILDGVSNENRLSPTTSYACSRLSRQSLRLSRPTSCVEIPIHLDVLDLTKPGHKRFKFRKVSRHRQAVTEEPATLQSLGILEILKTFWPGLNRKARITLIAAVGCAVMHAAATPTFAFLFSRLLSTLYATENRQKLALTYSLSILGVAIIDGMASYGFHFLFDSCAQTWANGLRSEAMKRILMQPREFFDREENSVSRLAECLDNFGEEARNLPGRFVGISIVVVSMIFIAVIWSLITCWKLTLVCLATAPILYVIMSTYNRISGHWETLANEADEKIGEVLHETFVNIRTVRCLVLEEVFRKKFQGATSSTLQTGVKRAVYTGALYGINYACVLFISALLFWFGAYVVSTGEFSVTGAIQTFSILLLSVSQINFLGNYIPQVNIARDAGSRLLRLARLPQDSHELGGTVQIKTADDIVLKGVRFSYPTRTDEQVLNRISFSIPRGSCTAIVGSSGSGKSTIAALLLKLYKTDASVIPNAADLSISGYNIKTIHTPTLRSRMAIVSQTPVIFPGTIAENIAYGLSPSSPRASLDSVRRAAMAAGVDDFVDSLPSGYQTVVGEGGSGLSGGQAQRIAIARALVRDPDILILDEATSALDVESAGIIRDTIQQLVMQTKNIGLWKNGIKSSQTGYSRNMTVIIITHAREMMAIAEHIIMLDKGRLVEEGGFEELERRRGPFSRLLRGIGDNAEQDGASALVY